MPNPVISETKYGYREFSAVSAERAGIWYVFKCMFEFQIVLGLLAR